MNMRIKKPMQEDKDHEEKKDDFLTKKRQKKQQVLTEEHHRRPRSLGGSNAPSNISYIPTKKHMAWHVLVGNMNAYQIAECLNACTQKPKNVSITCQFINGQKVEKLGQNNSKNTHKIHKAWKELFDDCETFELVVAYINNTLLDPSYHLYLNWCDDKELLCSSFF